MHDKRILITRPSHDDTTHYLNVWSHEIIKFANDHRFDVNDLNDEKANRKNFENVVKTMKPRLIIFNGHGSSDMICGHNNEVLVKLNDNEKILKSSIVYARSCETCQELAQKAVDSGADAYIGYEKQFIFLTDEHKASRPLSDEIAKPFFETSNAIPKSLIKGNSVKQAISNSNMHLSKVVDYHMAHYTLESSAIIFFLRWNADCQKVCGNEDAIV